MYQRQQLLMYILLNLVVHILVSVSSNGIPGVLRLFLHTV